MKKIAVVGGGSGSFSVLRGLKQYPLEITAIVSTFDNGGSSGILRDEFGTLPPGDIRRCLVALAPESDDPTLRDLFSYRFASESSLKGHSFGNLFLQALKQVTGSETRAIKKAAELLNCRGTVLPVSIDSAQVCAELENGEVIRGETNIDIPKHDPAIRIKRVYLDTKAIMYEEAYQALVEADLVVIGPGDLYTSIIPNMLAEGFTEALMKRTGKLAYVLNIMTKWGETNNFTASDFAREIAKYARQDYLDYVVCNSAAIPQELALEYAAEQSVPVVIDPGLNQYAKEIISADLISRADILRHDSTKIAHTLASLV